MALINFTQTESGSHYDRFNIATWVLATGDTAAPIQLAMSGDRSVQVSAAATIEGSNDGVTYFTLNDASGSPLALAGPGLKQILEITRWIRPAGAAVGPVTITLLAKRQED